MDPRCDITELLVSACGCPKHRDGKTIEEEIAREGLGKWSEARSSDELEIGNWFEAQWPGECGNCGEGFEAGSQVRRYGAGWQAKCCARVWGDNVRVVGA